MTLSTRLESLERSHGMPARCGVCGGYRLESCAQLQCYLHLAQAQGFCSATCVCPTASAWCAVAQDYVAVHTERRDGRVDLEKVCPLIARGMGMDPDEVLAELRRILGEHGWLEED